MSRRWPDERRGSRIASLFCLARTKWMEQHNPSQLSELRLNPCCSYCVLRAPSVLEFAPAENCSPIIAAVGRTNIYDIYSLFGWLGLVYARDAAALLPATYKRHHEFSRRRLLGFIRVKKLKRIHFALGTVSVAAPFVVLLPTKSRPASSELTRSARALARSSKWENFN